MTHSIYKDRVRETCTFAGVGNVALTGAVNGTQVFPDERCDYVLESSDKSLWEVGKGVVAAGVLTRNTVLDNSSGNTSKIDFGVVGGVAFMPASANQINTISHQNSIMSSISDGGLITEASATTFDVPAGSGNVIDAYTDPEIVDVTHVEWSAINGTTLNMPLDVGLTALFITSAGALLQVSGRPSAQHRRENILIGGIYYESGAITSVINAPSVMRQTANDFRDYIGFIGETNFIKDAVVSAVTGALSFWQTAGELFLLGSNYHVNPDNPNISVVPQKGNATTPAVFDSFFESGTINASALTVIPKTYESATDTETALGSNKAVIHYLSQTLGGDFYLQLGQIEYSNYADAVANLHVDSVNFRHAAVADAFFLSAQIVVNSVATSFDDSNAGIFQLARGASGGTAASNSAANITYDNSASGLSAINVQDALDEIDTTVDAKLDNVVEDLTPQLGGDLDLNTHDIPVSPTQQTALDGKVDDAQVLTNVPAGALFTDTVTIVNNTLTSTSTTEALSAAQGKNLQDNKEPANANIQSHIASTANPHSVDKTDVALGNVDNTSDANKPVSTAQQTEIDTKLDHTNGVSTGMYQTIIALAAGLNMDVSAAEVFTKTTTGTGTFAFTFSGWTANASSVVLEVIADGTEIFTFAGVTFKDAPVLAAGLNTLIFTSVDGGTTKNGYVARDGA